jgi:signal transduction histidine kinase
MNAARLQLALLRRALLQWHPAFLCAVPLAALGLLTPLLPQTLTACVLLSSGALFALLGSQAVRSTRAALPARAMDPDAIAQHPHSPAACKLSQIALDAAPRSLSGPLTKQSRPERDRTWADLMARINHDLRTPLNAVIGFSELMVLEIFGPLGDERYQDYAQHIRDSATDLLKSAEDTLALTALTADPNRHKEATASDLELLGSDAWSFVCRKAAARAVTLVSSLPPGLEVLGEPRTLRQILVNMLSEAIARAAHGERVLLSAAIEGELVELSVSVSKERTAPVRRGGSLAVCLARTLLEMQGNSLLEVVSSSGWRALTVLDRVVQPDFFSEPAGAGACERSAALAV